jgi:hypothetical protein
MKSCYHVKSILCKKFGVRDTYSIFCLYSNLHDFGPCRIEYDLTSFFPIQNGDAYLYPLPISDFTN